MVAKLAVVAAAVLFAGLAGTTSAASISLNSREIAVHDNSGTAATALPCSPQQGDKLVWYGGPVNGIGLISIVYWGSWWQAHGQAVKSELSALYKDLGSSSWAATLSQYCGSKGVRPVFPTLIGSEVVTSPPVPKAPTDDQLRYLAAHTCCGEFASMVVIVTPPGAAPVFDTNNMACGHHSWALLPTNSYLPWIDIPYGMIHFNAYRCQMKQGVQGAVSVVASHEWAEAITDPFDGAPNPPKIGWGTATTGQEVADVCHNQALHPFFLLKLASGSFVVPQLWSNAAGACVDSS